MRRTTRLGAYVASAALTISGLGVVVPPAHAGTHDPIGATEGAGWLAGQLTDGLLHNDQYDFDDIGLSIDAALALDAVGGHDATVGEIADAVAAKVNGYTSGADWGSPDDIYAGSVAKAAVLAQVAGDDPAAFGGVDLIDRLEGRVGTAAPIEGRVQDTGTPDYVNVLGQALAARALDEAGSALADEVTAFLLQQQCTSGYFRLDLTADKSADQSCQESTHAPDTDATAFAMLQLAPQAGGDPAVDAALVKARTWLLGVQKGDGSFGPGTSTEGSNANSTGLAGWALGDSAEAREAAAWLRDHQATAYDLCGKLAADRGAVAYDHAGLAAGRTDGIITTSQDQWRRASAQAVPALVHLAADTTPSNPMLSAPTGYQKAGSRLALQVSGVVDGDRLCVTGPGAGVTGTAAGDSWSVDVTTPAGTATRTYTVHDERGHADAASVKVLGAKTFRITKTKSRVRRSGKVTVTINGLASGERAAILFKGDVKKRGVATDGGTFSATFRVGRVTGVKKVVGLGQFGDIRRGTTTIRVVR